MAYEYLQRKAYQYITDYFNGPPFMGKYKLFTENMDDPTIICFNNLNLIIEHIYHVIDRDRQITFNNVICQLMEPILEIYGFSANIQISIHENPYFDYIYASYGNNKGVKCKLFMQVTYNNSRGQYTLSLTPYFIDFKNKIPSALLLFLDPKQYMRQYINIIEKIDQRHTTDIYKVINYLMEGISAKEHDMFNKYLSLKAIVSDNYGNTDILKIIMCDYLMIS